MGGLAYISVLTPDDAHAPHDLLQAYELFYELIPASRRFSVPKIMRVFSLRPAYMRAGITLWASMWHGPLPRHIKESLAVAVSIANQCPY